jgi:hypothetical protein
MSRLTMRPIIALITFGIGAALGTLWLTPRLRPAAQGSPVAEVRVSAPETGGEIFSGPLVSYGGVSFSIDPSLAASVKAEIKPASPLQDKTDKPGGVAPEHIAFTFTGPYAALHEQSAFSPPEIHIYPIEGYKQAYSIEPHYVALVEDEVQRLKEALARRPRSFGDGIPYIDFVDAHQAFQAHAQYLDFQNGRGIFFLTQYVFEPTVINNQELTYIFQGLTNDGKYYVSATFPVSAPVLPDNDSEESSQKDRLYDSACLTCPQYGPRNRAYLKSITRKLESLPPQQFQPKLTAFDATLRSLRVQIVGPDERRPTR